MAKASLKRSEAAEVLTRVSEILGQAAHNETNYGETIRKLEKLLYDTNIPLARKCIGDAHSNPHIDNCGACAPQWGWIVPKIEVR